MYHYGIMKLSDGSKKIISLEKKATSNWWMKNFGTYPQDIYYYLSARVGVKKTWEAYQRGKPYTTPSISTNGSVIFSYNTIILTHDPKLTERYGQWEVYTIPGRPESKKIYLNIQKHSKTTSSQQHGLVRLLNKSGYFRLSGDQTWGNEIIVRELECFSCKGSGGSQEEKSGGHKDFNECTKCSGTGMDPEMVDEFSRLEVG